jgi:hypothetical protein
MPLDPIRTLAARSLAAKDARGDWRPHRDAVAAMQSAGTRPLVATMCADAMVRIARQLRGMSAGARS